MQHEPFRYPVHVWAEASVHPSEDPVRVRAAVENLLPRAEARFEPDRNRVVAQGSAASLVGLYEGGRSRRILGVLRRLLLRNSSGEETWVLVHKQAAYARRLALCEEEAESPLGPIRISLRSQYLQELIEWLAPPT